MKQALIAGSLMLVSFSAIAQDAKPGFYIAVSGGNSKYDLSQGALDDISISAFEDNGAIVLDPSSSFDDTGTAWAIHGGYRFFPFFSVEAGYVDLGSTKYRAASPVFVPFAGVQPSTVGIDLSAKGPVVAALASAPFGRFDVHTSLGAFFAKTQFDISLSLGPFSDSLKVSSHSQELFAGVGMAYHFTDAVAASFDFTRFKAVGEEDTTGEGDIMSLRLGLQYLIHSASRRR